MKKQAFFLLRIVFWDSVAVLLLLCFFVYAHGQPDTLTVTSYELGRGIIAPDAMATIRGQAFTNEPQQAYLYGLPTEMGGVRVWVGGKEQGQLAWLRYVGYDEICIVMPSIPPQASWLFGWQRVDVESPLGNYAGLVLVMPVSAEIFTNHCLDSESCINNLPFGGAWVNRTRVIPTLNEAIPNLSTQIWLYGSGWRHSPRIIIWLFDEFGGEVMTEGHVEPHEKFSGWDQVSFTLPANILRDGVLVPLRGRITIQVAAQQPFPMRWWSFVNPIQITVTE